VSVDDAGVCVFGGQQHGFDVLSAGVEHFEG
jgi:hypothetical protein